MSQSNRGDVLYKIVLVGDAGVGKSALFQQIGDKEFVKGYKATTGIDFIINKLPNNIKLQVWDTAGAEESRAISLAYLRGAKAIIITYDITNRKSFNNVKKWIDEIKKNVPKGSQLFLLGTKKDLAAERKITLEEAKALAIKLSTPDYPVETETFEVNVKEKDKVIEIFNNVAESIHAKDVALQKSKKPSTLQRFKDFCQRNRSVLIGVGVGLAIVAAVSLFALVGYFFLPAIILTATASALVGGSTITLITSLGISTLGASALATALSGVIFGAIAAAIAGVADACIHLPAKPAKNNDVIAAKEDSIPAALQVPPSLSPRNIKVGLANGEENFKSESASANQGSVKPAEPVKAVNPVKPAGPINLVKSVTPGMSASQ